MYYGEIKNCDIANGIGVRVSLFVSGCTNHCEQCFQPETWNFSYGEPFTRQTEETLLSLLAPSYIDRFCTGYARSIRKRPFGAFPALRWRS